MSSAAGYLAFRKAIRALLAEGAFDHLRPEVLEKLKALVDGRIRSCDVSEATLRRIIDGLVAEGTPIIARVITGRLHRLDSIRDNQTVGVHRACGAFETQYTWVTPRALALLDLASLLVPKRVREEEIGDALEDIHNRLCLGQPPWMIYLRVASTLFWVAINSLREITGALLGRSKAGTRG